MPLKVGRPYKEVLDEMIGDIIDAAFDYDDEEETRASIKVVTNMKLKIARSPDDRRLIIDAYNKISEMSLDEIQNIYDKINGYEDEDEEEEEDETIEIDASLYLDVIYDHWHNDQLRDKLLSYENDENGYFYIHDENNDGKGYGIRCKVKYENDYYFYLLYLVDLIEPKGKRAVISTFYKLEMAKDPSDDRLTRVKDDNLKDKLKKLAEQICYPSGDDDK